MTDTDRLAALLHEALCGPDLPVGPMPLGCGETCRYFAPRLIAKGVRVEDEGPLRAAGKRLSDAIADKAAVRRLPLVIDSPEDAAFLDALKVFRAALAAQPTPALDREGEA